MGETNGIYYALQIKMISIIHWKILTKTLACILFLMLIYFHSHTAVSHIPQFRDLDVSAGYAHL